MARQEGVILLTGPVGNLSFYKSGGIYFVRRKSGVSGERIKTEPAYARTRENIAEFGRASLATKLFRTALNGYIRHAADIRVTGRLTGAMVKVIQGDAVNPRGQRNVNDGQNALLNGFEFNRNCKLSDTLRAPFTASIDRTTGRMILEIPAFKPAQVIHAPGHATHFRVYVVGALMDFQSNACSVVNTQSVEIPISGEEHEPLKLSLTVASDAGLPMFLMAGVEFLQLVNGTHYHLNDRAFNALAIVKVDSDKAPLIRKNNTVHHNRVSDHLAQSRRRMYHTPRHAERRPAVRPTARPGVFNPARSRNRGPEEYNDVFNKSSPAYADGPEYSQTRPMSGGTPAGDTS